MSYTEYMNRKKAASEYVLDTRPKMTASDYIRHKRTVAAAGVFAPTKSVVGNIDDMHFSPTVRTIVDRTSVQGGRVPDASTRSDYIAGLAARNERIPTDRIVIKQNNAVGCITIPEPVASKSASDFIRTVAPCTNGREPHNASELGPSVFVDDTIRIHSGIKGGADKSCPVANHTHPVIKPRASWAPRPDKGAGGIPVYDVASPDEARKVGALIPRAKYVERHHGNDLNVEPRRVPTPYILANGPAQLKINTPKPTLTQ